MFTENHFRHWAYNVKTEVIIATNSSSQLKKRTAHHTRYDRSLGEPGAGQWRFCHDFGKNWQKNGLPQR